MRTAFRLLTTLAILALWAPAMASPDEYRYGGSPKYEYKQGYLEIKGRVQGFDAAKGWISVNGQRMSLARDVYYEYGRPQVGSYVEIKAYRDQNRWVVYKVELKYR